MCPRHATVLAAQAQCQFSPMHRHPCLASGKPFPRGGGESTGGRRIVEGFAPTAPSKNSQVAMNGAEQLSLPRGAKSHSGDLPGCCDRHHPRTAVVGRRRRRRWSTGGKADTRSHGIDVAVGHDRKADCVSIAYTESRIETEAERILPTPLARIAIVEVVVRNSSGNP